MSSVPPFAWALRPSQLSTPRGPLAQLLRHEHAALLSEALQGGFRLIYGWPGREAKGRAFLGECKRDDRAAMDRFHELLAFALLSLERWLFVEVEPDLGGAGHPEFLMAAPPGLQPILIEVKTVHRAAALTPSCETQAAFEAMVGSRLARAGYECKAVALHALPRQVPIDAQYEDVVSIVLIQLRRSLLKPRGSFSVELPTGARLDLLLSDPGFRGSASGRMRELEEARFSVNRTFHETFRFFREQEALTASYGRKIPTRIGRAAAQMERSAASFPAVVAIAMSDPEWTVRGALDAIRDELRLRRAGGSGPVALLVVSFFQPKPEPVPDAPDWVKAAELARWHETSVLGSHAAWVRLQDTAPTMSHIWTFDPTGPKSPVTAPTLSAAPKPVGVRARRSSAQRRKGH